MKPHVLNATQRIWMAVLFVLTFAVLLSAQSTTDGAIGGARFFAHQAVVPQAHVLVRNKRKNTHAPQTAISNLPINGGRWSSFAILTPGVVSDSSGFGLLSFRGMSTLLNNNTVDGADNNQAFFSEERGRTRIGYSSPMAAVDEFQVNTSNHSSEYGRSAGGVVNTVTQSRTNALHRATYYYLPTHPV